MNNDPNRIITETVPVFFFIWDAIQKKIIYVSPKFYELAIGSTYQKNEKDLTPYIDPSHHDDYFRFFESLSPKNNYTNKTELRTSHLLKDVKWIEIKSFPVEEDKNKVELVVGHIVDITRRKNRIKDLEGANQNFDNIIQLISHDLRQPFTKITLLADMIRIDDGHDIESIHKYADKLKEVSYSAHELLQNFLELTILNYSGEILGTVPEDLNKLIREAVKNFDLELEKKKLKLNFEIPDESFIYPVDNSLFSQSVKNLISNSIKFTPSGGSITIKLTRTKHFYELSVADTGIGIPEDIKKRLFEEITSVRRAGLEGEISTGLGLIITKRIIELHNGSIRIESFTDQGTTFTIELPLAPHHTES